jgi:hypothetical protein
MRSVLEQLDLNSRTERIEALHDNALYGDEVYAHGALCTVGIASNYRLCDRTMLSIPLLYPLWARWLRSIKLKPCIAGYAAQ